jgi:hypothetical protein
MALGHPEKDGWQWLINNGTILTGNPEIILLKD